MHECMIKSRQTRLKRRRAYMEKFKKKKKNLHFQLHLQGLSGESVGRHECMSTQGKQGEKKNSEKFRHLLLAFSRSIYGFAVTYDTT